MVAQVHMVTGSRGGPTAYEVECVECELSLPFKSRPNAVIVQDKHNVDKHGEESVL